MDANYVTEELIKNIQQYAKGRASDVKRGAETPRFAALLLQKYGYGILEAVRILDDENRTIDTAKLWKVVDEEVEKIDPQWREHMHKRWEGKPADITY